MKEGCIEHPWMTFIIVFLIESLGVIANNILRVILGLKDKK